MTALDILFVYISVNLSAKLIEITMWYAINIHTSRICIIYTIIDKDDIQQQQIWL